ncbi:MAG: hypothetical protein WCX73_01170, partial [Candidatus Pacearchaeota archaeon]
SWSLGSCNNQDCEKACCILGSQAKFTTEKNCEIEAGFLGIPIDFRTDVQTEVECIFLTQKDDEGACVYESGEDTTCLYTTREDCLSRTGNANDFYKNTFCSSPELNTSCATHDYEGCVDGKDEVYWYDSCGNQEDVKQNCSIFLGSVCGEYRDGIDTRENPQDKYVCRSLDCKADNGMNYKNGESWCEYEGTIGDGKDVVGSRHVKHICYMGEETIEPCADYRNQICVGTEVNIGNGETFSEAVCRQNNWQDCLNRNDGNGDASSGNNPDCMTKSVDIGDDFKFSVAVPEYPPGFDLENNYESAQGICSLGSQKCTVVYVKRLSGWKCEYNCDCEETKFTQVMNDVCISLGDCGGYVNTEGKYTADGYTSGAGKISGTQYTTYASPKRNLEMAEPGNISEFLGTYGLTSGGGYEPQNSKLLTYAALGVMGVQLLGLTKSLAASSSLGGIGNMFTSGADPAIAKAAGAMAGEGIAPTAAQNQLATSQVGFGNLFASIGAGLAVGSILSMAFGMPQGQAMMIGLAVGGALLLATKAGWLSSAALSWISTGLFVVTIIFMFMGLGKTKEKTITFTCLPWQAPAGGADCEKCNPENEFDVPCSEYKCSSLGQACDFINEGTTDERCINTCQGSISSARITPMLENISEGYVYEDITDSGFSIKAENGDCIDEYTSVTYGIKTNKYAQCKIGTDPLETYDEMDELFFGGKNTYTMNHTDVMFMPSIAAFKNHYNLTQEEIADLGELTFYIKCKESCDGITNTAAYTVRTCVNPGPDITAPVIQKVIPDSGSFVKYEETKKDILLWVNEPAECRWDTVDIDYDNMINNMTCQAGLNDYQLYGWPCNTTLTGVNNNSNFYFRCKDQPLEVADADVTRNKMTQSYVYEVGISESPLEIIDFKPEIDYEFLEGTEPVEINLNVRTSGGAEDGKSICQWRLEGFSFDQLAETDSDYHSGIWSTGFRGTHTVDYYCEDAAGNNATTSTFFKIKIDSSGPKIIRAYFDNVLKIVTDEQAECRYGFNNNFKFDNATEMDGDGIEHTADWQLKTYYIQCKDVFNRKGSKIIIKAYDLI